MSSVDNRVVNMKFNNSQFESGVQKTLASLKNLQEGLKFKDGTKGMSDIEKKANSFSMSGMAKAIDTIASRFSTLGIIGTTTLANLTNSAVNAGKHMMSALIDPLVAGGKRRALNLEHAEFQIEGLGYKWEQVKGDIDYGVADTAYGLDVAAKAAGQLLASNVQVGDSMKTALRGISGVAAMTSSEYEDISMIFTTVAGNGRLMGDQLMQLSSRGINAAATLGKYLGKTEEEIRDMTSKGQIDFATFAAAMDDAFGAHAKEANKTFTGSMANMKAALSRIGADFATPIYQNMIPVFNALKDVFKGVHEGLKPLIGDFGNWVSQMSSGAVDILQNLDLEPLKHVFEVIRVSAGGVFDALKNIFSGLPSIINPIKEAFSNVFPPVAIETVQGFADKLRELTSGFGLSETAANNLRTTFEGLFSIIKMAGSIVITLASGFFSIITAFSPLGELFLMGTSALGGFVKGVSDAASQTNILGAVLTGLADKLKTVIGWISNLGTNLSSVFSSMAQSFSGPLSELSQGFSELVANFDIDKLFTILNGILAGGMFVAIKNFFDGLKSSVGEFKGFFDAIKAVLLELKNTLVAYQNDIKAGTLIKIATAVGILAASIVALSLVNPERLVAALTAMTVAFGELIGALTVFEKIMAASNVNGIAKAAASMVLLSSAILILSAAVKVLGSLDTASMAQGLIGLGIAFAELAIVMNYADFGGLGIRSSIGLIAMGSALLILSGAVKVLSSIDFSGLVQGLMAVGVLLAEISIFVQATGNAKKVLATSAALLVISASLLALSGALRILGGMSFESLVTALVALAGSMAIFAVAMQAMKKALPGAAALLVIAAAMAVLAPMLVLLGTMSLESIGKALLALAGTFVIFGAAATALAPAIPAMLGLAGSIALLGAGVLAAGVGLTALATGLGLLSVSATGAATAITLIFSAIIGLIPALLTAIGEGIVGILEIIGNSGEQILTAITTILTSIIQALITVVPLLGELFLVLIQTLTTALTEALPQIVALIGLLVQSFIQIVTENIPLLVQAGLTLILSLLQGISANAYQMASAAVSAIANFINGVASQIGAVIQAAINLALAFVNGVADGIRNNQDAFKSAVMNLITSVGSVIAGMLGDLGSFGMNIIQGLVQGVVNAAGRLIEAVGNAVTGALNWAKSLLGIASPSKEFAKIGKFSIMGFAKGFDDNSYISEKASGDAAKKSLNAIATEMSRINDVVDAHLDVNPTITPVLDLSNVKSGAKDLRSTFSDGSMVLDLSSSRSLARSISVKDELKIAGSEAKEPTVINNYDLTQNNYSPKALSTAEIYRKTKNQFSTLKAVKGR